MARMAVLSNRKRVAVLVTATGLLALGAWAWIALSATQERVSPAEVSTEHQAPRIAADHPVAAAPAETEYTTVVDATSELLPVFTGDLSYARTLAQGSEQFPYAEPDQCLLDWATANLAALSETGTYDVLMVCDRPTLVLAGPEGADTKVFAHGALTDTAPAGARQLVGESTHDRMAFVAVRSADGKAQLLATAELPE